MNLALVALLGAVAMGVQDFAAALLGVAEARGRAVLAGLLGMVQDVTMLATFGIGLNNANAHGWSVRSVVVIGALMLASFTGKSAGTFYGTKRMAVDIHVKNAIEGAKS